MIVYLHGFNSGGASQKARWLRAHLAPIAVLAPDYPAHRAVEAETFLRQWIADARATQRADRLLLIGSSLGGFWAQALAPVLHAGLVLINPAVRPQHDLLRAVGENVNEATGERYVLTTAEVAALGDHAIAQCNPRVPTLLLLDENDEVLDYRVARDLYRSCGETIIFSAGSHRFDHLPEALPAIRLLYEGLARISF